MAALAALFLPFVVGQHAKADVTAVVKALKSNIATLESYLPHRSRKQAIPLIPACNNLVQKGRVSPRGPVQGDPRLLRKTLEPVNNPSDAQSLTASFVYHGRVHEQVSKVPVPLTQGEQQGTAASPQIRLTSALLYHH